MFKNFRKKEAILLCFSFWATIVATRSFLFVASVWHDRDPRIVIENFYVHHYLLGIALLSIAGISLALRIHERFLQLAGIGVGIALVADEFSFLSTFSMRQYWSLTQGDYWSITNFFAIIATGSFLIFMAGLAKGGTKAKAKKVAASSGLETAAPKRKFVRNWLFPAVLVAAFLFALFYNANPSISHAKEIKPIVKHLQTAGKSFREGRYLLWK